MSYQYTRPCSNITKTGDSFTTCTRDNCTFAHTLSELRVIPCRTGDSCGYKNTTCRFFHAGDTVKGVYSRCGMELPVLPENYPEPSIDDLINSLDNINIDETPRERVFTAKFSRDTPVEEMLLVIGAARLAYTKLVIDFE